MQPSPTSSNDLADSRTWAWPLIAVMAATGLSFVVARVLPHANLSLVFLAGVLVVSARMGLVPGLVASLLSFLLFNFLFTPPYFSLNVHDDGDLATLAFFLLMAAITGNLAARMRYEMEQRRASLERTSHLFEFSAKMSSATECDNILAILAEELATCLDCSVTVALAGEQRAFEQTSSAGAMAAVPARELATAWSDRHAGFAKPGGKTAIALSGPGGDLGLAVIDRLEEIPRADMDLARSLCDQAAIALDRTLLERRLEEARLANETERLRSALLSSLSHDLRTPLASVIGSTTSLIEYGGSFSDADRDALLQTTLTEARRLDRYIQNLLDMTRLGHGKISLARGWVDLDDVVAGALGRLDRPEAVRVILQLEDDIPLLWVHGALIEQALVNLLDNAFRYSPEGGEVTIAARVVGDDLELDVIDQGLGIPEEDRERVFDMFFTAQQGDRGRQAGTGLGLAICRGMIGAHLGSVTAHDGPDGRGTRMHIRLPLHAPDNPETDR